MSQSSARYEHPVQQLPIGSANREGCFCPSQQPEPLRYLHAPRLHCIAYTCHTYRHLHSALRYPSLRARTYILFPWFSSRNDLAMASIYSLPAELLRAIVDATDDQPTICRLTLLRLFHRNARAALYENPQLASLQQGKHFHKVISSSDRGDTVRTLAVGSGCIDQDVRFCFSANARLS